MRNACSVGLRQLLSLSLRVPEFAEPCAQHRTLACHCEEVAAAADEAIPWLRAERDNSTSDIGDRFAALAMTLPKFLSRRHAPSGTTSDENAHKGLGYGAPPCFQISHSEAMTG